MGLLQFHGPYALLSKHYMLLRALITTWEKSTTGHLFLIHQLTPKEIDASCMPANIASFHCLLFAEKCQFSSDYACHNSHM